MLAMHARALCTVATLVALVLAANLLAHEIAGALDFEIKPSNEDLVHRTLMTTAVVYAVLIAVPFVPGVEIAFTLIAVFGPAVVILVYVCTLAGLSVSFLVGRLIPLATLGRLFDELYLQRASALVAKLEPLDPQARVALLLRDAPGRLVPFLVRHRYLVLALALNVPGNLVIGGGGGIALTAGVSRLYSVPGFLLTVALAVAPVPLAVLLFGKEILTS